MIETPLGFHRFFSPIILLHHILSKPIRVPSNVSPLLLTIDLSTLFRQGSSKNQECIPALLVLVVRRRGLLVAVTGGVVLFRCRKSIASWQFYSIATSSDQFSPGNVAHHGTTMVQPTVALHHRLSLQALEMLEKKEKVLLKKVGVKVEQRKELTRA
uniref:Uncharacterized protein n=1 Tax=Lactuca sativa TaxID=4236 RepID=A0A9R1WQF0_LACSA|nr:hypothetical protein LSAT_V11C100044520 [Lactuca sativa]